MCICLILLIVTSPSCLSLCMDTLFNKEIIKFKRPLNQPMIYNHHTIVYVLIFNIFDISI